MDYLNLPRLAGPAAGPSLSVRLSSGCLYIRVILGVHGRGVLGPQTQ
jgi:hypothetical protein